MSEGEWSVVGARGKSRPKQTAQRAQQTQHSQTNYSDDTIVFATKKKNTATVQKFSSQIGNLNSNNNNLDHQRARKIEEQIEEGNFQTEQSNKNLQNAIVKARTGLKLNQKQFAQKCNIKENVIKSYENGTGVPTNEHLNIMSNVTGVVLKKNH
jgi:putative transcription factor